MAISTSEVAKPPTGWTDRDRTEGQEPDARPVVEGVRGFEKSGDPADSGSGAEAPIGLGRIKSEI
jgi:hypothetical protein